VKGITRNQLREIAYWNWNKGENKTASSKSTSAKSTSDDFHRYLADKINHFFSEKEEFSIPSELAIPDGAPIGTTDLSCDFEY
jgi:hypothetical protein